MPSPASASASSGSTPPAVTRSPYEQIVKGYEISPDKYVTITPEELDALQPQKTRTIDIEEFVDLEQIDPIYYDHPYFLVPDKGAAKAYKLLLDAMEEADKVAIARVVIRSKENLVALRSYNGAITMETMLFPDEVVDPDSIEELAGRRRRGQDDEARARHGEAADRVAVGRLRCERVQGRVPRGRARHDRAQGGRRDDHDRGAGAGAQGGAGPHGRARGVDRGSSKSPPKKRTARSSNGVWHRRKKRQRRRSRCRPLAGSPSTSRVTSSRCPIWTR